jgi:hypothetical protein
MQDSFRFNKSTEDLYIEMLSKGIGFAQYSSSIAIVV